MMTSSGLADPVPRLIADASAVINLLACGAARTVLESLPLRLAVVEQVSSELAAGQRRGWDSWDLLAGLVTAGTIEIVGLGDCSCECFESLVVGAAVDTIDDGEAATIAYAHTAGAEALVDERKARRICRSRFAGLGVHTTFDLLASRHVTRVLGQSAAAEAIYNALMIGRMRVPATDYRRVVSMIGIERARMCSSLPEHVRFPKKKRAG